MARSRQSAHNAPGVLTPQGRLTLATGTPVMTTEQAAKQNIYYTPYVGDRIPLYNGTEWVNTLFTELTLALAGDADWVSGKNYDLYVYNDAGTIRLLTGAAWTDDTTRAESLTRLNGILTNTASMTGRYGASDTTTVAANRGTYVGTVRMSATGTTTWELGGTAAGGDPGFLYLWNCYNQRAVEIQVKESTNSWTYGTVTIRPANNSTSNRVSFVIGISEYSVHAEYQQVTFMTTGELDNPTTGIGFDSTTGYSAFATQFSGPSTNLYGFYSGSTLSLFPGIGLHFVQALESVFTGGIDTGNFFGDGGGNRQTGLIFNGMF